MNPHIIARTPLHSRLCRATIDRPELATDGTERQHLLISLSLMTGLAPSARQSKIHLMLLDYLNHARRCMAIAIIATAQFLRYAYIAH